MRRPQWLGAVRALLVLAGATCAPAAHADDPPAGDTQKAAAADEAIERFDTGLAAMLARDFATGCPALAESYHLDPKLGSLFTLAECHKDWGKTASAAAHYEAFLAKYRALAPADQRAQHARARVARQALATIGPRIPRLRIDLAEGWPAGTTVLDDGAALGASDLGVPRRVDPGRHVIEVRAPGDEGPTSRSELVVEPGSRAVITVPAPVRAGAPPAPISVQRDAPAPVDAGRGATQRSVGIGLGGVGILGLGVGAVADALALSDAGTVEDDCGDDHLCNTQGGKDAADRAQDKARISTVGFVAGGVLLAAGITVWLAAPRAEEPAIAVGVRAARGGAMAATEVRW
ncbi:MAG: hypothetical protein WKG00_32945 [Polyangiaceae bacterium]